MLSKVIKIKHEFEAERYQLVSENILEVIEFVVEEGIHEYLYLMRQS